MGTNWQIGERILNRWQIYNILGGPGSSGMGIIYVVYDHQHRNVYAAKTYQGDMFARNSLIADRFEQEAHVWINLDVHQNVTQARFIEIINHRPYLFLEYVSGGDLSRWIATPRLTRDFLQILRFAIQFCDGMTHAVSRGIKAHRDIKPQNCLITHDNILKVTDFGLVKTLGELNSRRVEYELNTQNLNINLTSTGVAAGTPLYMAPEQFEDAKNIDVRADIYSFGIMLFEMATGELPFIGSSWGELERLHRTHPPPLLNIRNEGLRHVIETCLAKDPINRFYAFHKIRELLAAIYEEQAGKPAPQPATGMELDAVLLHNKGLSLYKLERYDEALACFDDTLAINPQAYETWSNKGSVLYALKRPAEALVCFDRALEINSRSENAWSNKGMALKALGNLSEALACFDQALEINLLLADAWFNRGVTLRKLGRTADAISSYDRALELNPRDEQAWMNKGNVLSDSGQFKEAITCFNRSLENNQRYADAWFNKGVLFADKLNRHREALAYFEEAQRLRHPRAAQAIAICREVLKNVAADESQDASAWLEKGIAFAEAQRWDEALELYRKALELNPYLDKAWVRRGLALHEMRRVSEEILCYDRALELNPYSAEAWNNKGRALSVLGQNEQALTCYDRAIEHAPSLAAIWANKATVLSMLGRYEEALYCCDQALKIEPLMEYVWMTKGQIFGDLDRPDEEMACYNRALEINSHFAEVWVNKGLLLVKTGSIEDAIKHYNRSLEINPRIAGTWLNKGNALRKLEQDAEAIACYEHAIQLDPRLAEAWYAKGIVAGASGRIQEAVDCFEQAQRLGLAQAAELVALLKQI